MASIQNILIFSDGACSGNPGPGGWGAILCLPSGEVRELGGSQARTTNNQMEMAAAIEALRTVAALPGKIEFYTDSTYVIQGITKWIWGWKQRGWKTAEGNEVSNRGLWESLFELVSARGKQNGITWHYVRGHVGTAGNERADEIAVAFAQSKAIPLYSGRFADYPHDLLKLPADTSLPSSSSSGKSKGKAHSYLSLVHGKAQRHASWAECEARVKGVPAAKFKKAMSEAEEKAILSSWGAALDE